MASAAGWNVQGKHVADISTAWPCLNLAGCDLLGLQEVGGLGEQTKPWDTLHVEFDEPWTFYCTNPPLARRAVLLGMPSRCTGNVEKVIPLDVGICVILKMSGYRQFVISAHLAHKQREDCLSCWQGLIHQLETILKGRRYHDVVVLTMDTNYELASTDGSDETEVYAKLLLRNFGLTHTSPSTYTWSNTRGSQSKIDYIFLSSPDNVIASQDVLIDSDVLLGADHRAVMAAFPVSREPRHRFRPSRKPNKCGKWIVDSSRVFKAAQDLCYQLGLNSRDLTNDDLAKLANLTSRRPTSYRYKDPPEILDKIRERRRLGGREARDLGKEIVRMRAVAKNQWLVSILDKSANSDFKAISYFRRRQSVLSSHNNYLLRAGGKTKAIDALKKHFRDKWTEPTPQSVSPLDVLHSGRISPLAAPPLVTEKEVCDVLFTCKQAKSCGPRRHLV